MKVSLVLLTLFGVASTLVTANKLVEVRPSEIQENVKKVEGVVAKQRVLYEELVSVTIQDDEQNFPVGSDAILPCIYSVCPDNGDPVVVTWKVGDDPLKSQPIAKCTFYDATCQELQVMDENYAGRLAMNFPGMADLTVRDVRNDDNRNYWCVVQMSDNPEYGTDAGSVVLRVTDTYNELPKFNHVFFPQNLEEAKIGQTVTLQCNCIGSHCEDVEWSKGPENEFGDVELVYRKQTAYRADPEVEYGTNWEGRISVDGYALTIYGVQPMDAGRYWCKASAASYTYAGETATDAKSIALTVDRQGEYPCA